MQWIKHPSLPGQEIEVPEQSLPHYFRSGWNTFTPETREVPDANVIDSDETPSETGDESPSASEETPTVRRASTSATRQRTAKGSDK